MKAVGIYKEMTVNSSVTESIHQHLMREPYPEKRSLLEYLTQSRESICVPTLLRDVLDGGSAICALNVFHDDAFSWRSDLAYYIDKYNLRPDEDFIAHVMKKMSKV